MTRVTNSGSRDSLFAAVVYWSMRNARKEPRAVERPAEPSGSRPQSPQVATI